MTVVDRTFYIHPSSVDSQHVLAFVKGGDMPNPDEVAPLASSLLQVESKPMTYVITDVVSMSSRVFLDPLPP